MLMITLVFAVASSVLMAAFRTPKVSEEFAMMLGKQAPSTSSGDRFTHLLFLLLCYCSTMMLALAVQIVNRLTRWYANYQPSRQQQSETTDPFA
jgi:hypothetical protein